MELRNLGDTGIQISPILMGTWQAGKAMWADIDDNDTRQAIRAAYDAGITTFDTAEVYGNGHSERILGEVLADIRDKVVIASKVFSNHLKANQVKISCHRSLKNLKTDYIDLYQIHWPPGSFGHAEVPVQETLQALNELKQEGKIRAIGVSNYNRGQLEEAAQHAEIVSLQPPYSLFWRQTDAEAAPYCREKGMTILAYSSMAQGLLTGKFGPRHQFKKGDHRASNRLLQPDHFKRVQAALKQLQPIADEKNATLGQLALAWVIAQPGTCAIAGGRSAEQMIQNAAATQIQLTESDLAQMEQISRSVTDHLDDDPVMWKW